jgi:hypothetical protein
MAKASFERAYLRRADFSHAILREASFVNADLLGVKFFAADFEQANLSVSIERPSPANWMLKEGWIPMPILACADLKGAKLNGRPLAVLTVRVREKPALGKTNIEIVISTVRDDDVVVDEKTEQNNPSVLLFLSLSDTYVGSEIEDELKTKLTALAKSADSGMRKSWGGPASDKVRWRNVAAFLTHSENIRTNLPYPIAEKFFRTVRNVSEFSGLRYAGQVKESGRTANDPKCKLKSSPLVNGFQSSEDLQLDGNNPAQEAGK